MTTTYWLPCRCGQKLRVQTTQAGTMIPCRCGAELTVPTLHEMARLELALSDEPAPARRTKPTWGKRQARILLGILLTAASLALLAYLELSRTRLRRVESLTPIQVWSLWLDLRRGPDRHLLPDEKQFVESLRMYRTWRCLLMVGAVAGLLLTGLFYAIPAPAASRRARAHCATSPPHVSGEPPHAKL